MSRVRINSYGASKSARLLSKYLGVKRLLLKGRSKFRGRGGDIIINWGNGKGNIGSARQINNLQNVQLASNKLSTLSILEAEGVNIPTYTRHPLEEDNALWVARMDLYGHSGRGIEVGTFDELPSAPLYTKYIDKVAEYRVIVVGKEVVDFKKKKRRNDYEGDYGEHVWNHSSGYIFARNDFVAPTECGKLGIDAISALGLDFGAVDVIEDEEGNLYVLEVNTAFGIEGTTLELVGDAIHKLIEEV
jgi:glutathione synthase/RimK-type ligase-like ATP-grasp enzyme